ncbi:RND transporter MFP subunit [Arsukibacterium ikkense]|uniref:RND transporter MFP subunit n=1 Tax=Arsukibacterium ikkense TaxID=336831 RepID=A0A0M2V4B1_9GAMM|nr:efflux RND transporter periplasmic adaptor subunit [Arsukibacterium ikkense]KKO44003.1 RND transporter MFP subunit [Arsukibacterium ikkense]
MKTIFLTPAKRLALAILAAVLFLTLIFLWLAGAFVSKVADESRPLAIAQNGQLYTVSRQPLAEYRYFSGNLQARQQTALSARITARVAEVLVEAGDRVQAGDVLLRLDNDDLSARVRQQEQALASAQARVNEARSQYQRTTTLVTQGLLPAAQRDEVRANRDTAEAELQRSRAALFEAQTSEGFSIMTAPYNGVISQRLVNTGDTATPGALLLTLYAPESLRFEASISESVLGLLQFGQQLQVQLDASQQPLLATVSEIEPAADTSSRNFRVRLDINRTAGLYPGMFGRLAVPIGERDAVLIPSLLIEQRGQLHYVQVRTAAGIERRLIRPGEQHLQNGQAMHEVLTGLAAGEQLQPR